MANITDMHDSISVLKMMRRGQPPEELFEKRSEAREQHFDAHVRTTAAALVLRQNEVQEKVHATLGDVSAAIELKPAEELAATLQKRVEELKLVQEQARKLLDTGNEELAARQQQVAPLVQELAEFRRGLRSIPPRSHRHETLLLKLGECASGELSFHIAKGAKK